MQFKAGGYPIRLAIISPHRDDAAFSCGILMSLCVQSGIDVTIANLFTESAYAPYVPATSVAEITRIRRGEDESLLRCLGPSSAMLDFHLKDAPLRLDIPAEQVVQSPLSAQRFHHEVEQLAPKLGSLADFDLILLPLGIGEHVDHCIAHDAGRLSLPPARVAFYEDLPYAARMAPTTRIAYGKDIGVADYPGMTSAIFAMENGAERKADLASLYSSQISGEVVSEMEQYAGARGGGELFHMPEAMAQEMRSYLRLHESVDELAIL